MALDLWTNSGLSTLAAGIDAVQTTIPVAAGTGARFPTGNFPLRVWNSADFANPIDDPAGEIVYCTSRSVDTLTVTRGQEGTAAAAHNTAGKTYSVILPLTKKFRDDVEGRLPDNKPIQAADIAAGAVGTTQLADLGVTSEKLADLGVTSAKLAAGAVVAGKIAAGAIVNADISATAAIGVNKLAKTTGSSSLSTFAVQQFAFASPQTQNTDVVGPRWYGIGSAVATERNWIQAGPSTTGIVTWDYLTTSGDPCIWAYVDAAGVIVSMWEAEDPADPEFPDELPGPVPSGLSAVRIQSVPEALMTTVLGWLAVAPFPSAFATSQYRDLRGPALLAALVKRQFDEHGLDVPPDIREVYTAIADPQKRLWRLQKFLRAASRMLHNHRAPTLIPLFQARYRVSPTGVLSLA